MEQSLFEKYAVFQHGGKQYQAIEGKTIALEKIDAEAGSTVEFADVLLKKDKDKVEVGQPFVGSKIKASVVKHLKSPKVVIFKFKRRKKSRVKTGHRQPQTVVRIEAI